MKPYLSVCAIYRNEADYMREWIEFHRLVGAERFFLYDNSSEDHHQEVLAPYVGDGTVVLKSWPESPGQQSAYEDCIATQRDASRWIAFLDLDEFLFSPTGRPLTDVLVEFERWPAVAANRAAFGTSGHETPPPGLVIENYTRRMHDERKRHRQVKSIVDPTRVRRGVGPHHFLYHDGFAVDENHSLLDTPPRARTNEVSFSLLRVNHYWTRSQQEWNRKLEMEDAWLGTLRENYEQGALSDRQKLERRLNEHPDDTITMYAPALRKALGMEPATQSSAV